MIRILNAEFLILNEGSLREGLTRLKRLNRNTGCRIPNS